MIKLVPHILPEIRFPILISGMVLVLFVGRVVSSKEVPADLYRSVGNATYIVTGTVSNTNPSKKEVTLTVDRWVKGTPLPSGHISIRGRTDFCVVQQDLPRYLKRGKRYLVFVFDSERRDRFGHYIRIEEDGSLQNKWNRHLYVAEPKPDTIDDLIQRIKNLQSKTFMQNKRMVILDEKSTKKEILSAIHDLAKLRRRDSFSLLIHVARDSNKSMRVRNATVKAIGKLEMSQAVQPLIKQSRSTPKLRLSVVKALGRIGDRRSASFLVANFHNAQNEQHQRLMGACVKSLGSIQSYSDPVKNVFREVIHLYGEKTAQPANNVFRIINEQKLYWMVPDLVKEIDSENSWVCDVSRSTLGRLAGTEIVRDQSAYLTREEALEAIKQSNLKYLQSIDRVRASYGLQQEDGSYGWLFVFPGHGQQAVHVVIGHRKKNSVRLWPR